MVEWHRAAIAPTVAGSGVGAGVTQQRGINNIFLLSKIYVSKWKEEAVPSL